MFDNLLNEKELGKSLLSLLSFSFIKKQSECLKIMNSFGIILPFYTKLSIVCDKCPIIVICVNNRQISEFGLFGRFYVG